MSDEQASANDSTEAMQIATYGVPCFGCSRPSALGIWRLVASEYAIREKPTIVLFTACSSTTAPRPPTA